MAQRPEKLDYGVRDTDDPPDHSFPVVPVILAFLAFALIPIVHFAVWIWMGMHGG